MKKIVIVDIDGTITKPGKRLKYLQQKPKDWDSFYNDCFEDEPIQEIVDLVKVLDLKYTIVFCTGRRESVREKTKKWLDIHLPNVLLNDGFLLMRANSDIRHDTIVKPELIAKKSIFSYDKIAFILEDRNAMVDKWRELGFKCLQVAEGNF